MHLRHLRALLALLLVSTSSFAQSSVTLWFAAEDLKAANNSFLEGGSLVLLLASVGTPSAGGPSFSTSLQAGSLETGAMLGAFQILGRAETGGLLDPEDVFGDTGSLQMGDTTFANLNPGDQLALAWFPTLTFADSFSLVSGTSYGLYTLDSSVAWQVPASSLTPFQVTAPSGLAANLTVTAVPEPATYAALLGCAALAAVAVRRRGKPAAPAQD